MNPDELESRMRALEVFHTLRVLPGAWVILRLDGRGFSRFTENRFEKPFDARFHDGMVQTARAVLEDLRGLYAYTESDESSVLFPRGWDLFDRELEKAVSLSAGIASAALSLQDSLRRVHMERRDVRRDISLPGRLRTRPSASVCEYLLR